MKYIEKDLKTQLIVPNGTIFKKVDDPKTIYTLDSIGPNILILWDKGDSTAYSIETINHYFINNIWVEYTEGINIDEELDYEIF